MTSKYFITDGDQVYKLEKSKKEDVKKLPKLQKAEHKKPVRHQRHLASGKIVTAGHGITKPIVNLNKPDKIVSIREYETDKPKENIKENEEFKLGDKVENQYGEEGVIVNGETGVFSVKYKDGRVEDVDEDEVGDFKKVTPKKEVFEEKHSDTSEEAKKEGVSFEVGGYLESRRYNKNALKLLQKEIKKNLGNETGNIEFSMSAKYQTPTIIFDKKELEIPIQNALDALDISYDETEEHSYGFRIPMSEQAYDEEMEKSKGTHKEYRPYKRDGNVFQRLTGVGKKLKESYEERKLSHPEIKEKIKDAIEDKVNDIYDNLQPELNIDKILEYVDIDPEQAFTDYVDRPDYSLESIKEAYDVDMNSWANDKISEDRSGTDEEDKEISEEDIQNAIEQADEDDVVFAIYEGNYRNALDDQPYIMSALLEDKEDEIKNNIKEQDIDEDEITDEVLTKWKEENPNIIKRVVRELLHKSLEESRE